MTVLGYRVLASFHGDPCSYIAYGNRLVYFTILEIRKINSIIHKLSKNEKTRKYSFPYVVTLNGADLYTDGILQK